MATTYLDQHNYKTTETFSQKLVLEDASNNLLDLSVGFVDEVVTTNKSFSNTFHIVPGRTSTNILSGTEQAVMSFTFRCPIWSLDGVDVEKAYKIIEDFFNDSAGGLVTIYWVKDDSDGYFAYLPSCVLQSVNEVRNHGRRIRGVSYTEVTVQSIVKDWVKTFPGDLADPATVIRGPWVHTASTNDGSVALAVVRESDQQGLLELTDDGFLRTYGPIKDNQDLSTWDLDLAEL